eukprot:s2064_g15.t1
MKELYHETKSKLATGDRKRKGKGGSETQNEYWGFMQQKMADLAKDGVQEASAEFSKAAEKEAKWILFDGTTEPVRLDKLSAAQEMMLENGKPHVYVEAPQK